VNPIVGDALQLQWSLVNSSHFTLEVLNTLGQILYQLPVSLDASSTTSNLPLILDAGMYIVRVRNEKGEKILRVWKP
ncbi:MAG: Secretion system C-terminal sorting domain, partial [Bacteroidota bacterium]